MSTAQQLYKYLKSNHKGIENGINRSILANKLGMSERDLRALTREINEDINIDGVVSTAGKIYLCDSKEEIVKNLHTTWKTAISLIRKARTMEKKLGLERQIYYDDELEELKERAIYGDKL